MLNKIFTTLFIFALLMFHQPCFAQVQCYETCVTYGGMNQCWEQCVQEPTYPSAPPAWTGCLPSCSPPETPLPTASIWEQRKTVADNVMTSVLESALGLDSCNNMLSTPTKSARDVARRWQSFDSAVRISRRDSGSTIAGTHPITGNVTLYPQFFSLTTSQQMLTILHEIGHATSKAYPVVTRDGSTVAPIFSPLDIRGGEMTLPNVFFNWHFQPLRTITPIERQVLGNAQYESQELYDRTLQENCHVQP